MSAEVLVERFRRLLFGVSAAIFALTPVELVLAKHYDTGVKLIPFVLCAVGLLAVLAAWLRPRRQTLLLLRGLMLVIIVGSVLGSVEHLSGNLEFALETHPGAPLSTLLVTALQGASPLLAPGILALAALLGIGATHAHPALARASQTAVRALAVSSH